MSSTSGQDIHGQGSLESGTGSFPEASAREFADKDGSLRRILLGWGGFLVRRFVDVEDNEVQPVIRAFCSFLLLMAAYFLCMPLRDEAGMSLGTGALPFLFVASLVVTIIAAPASSALLTRPDISKGRGPDWKGRRFFCCTDSLEPLSFSSFLYTLWCQGILTSLV